MAAIWRKLVEGNWAQGLLSRFAIAKDRRVQLDLDIQRLYVASQLHLAAASKKAFDYQRLVVESQSTSPAVQREHVAWHIRDQIMGSGRTLHTVLTNAGDAAPAAKRMELAHADLTATPLAAVKDMARSAASSAGIAGEQRSDETSSASTSGRCLSQAEVSELFKSQHCFTLDVKESSVKGAGLGLFIRGNARPGTVVGLIPGVVYLRTQLNKMPNFPKIDQDNHFLSSSYDMTIVDSKPWGLGDPGSKDGAWANVTSPAAQHLNLLEGRHPLALGHYVNHPGQGSQPNVLEVLFNLRLAPSEEPWLRAYIPSVPYLAEDQVEEGAAEALLSLSYGHQSLKDRLARQDGHAAGAHASVGLAVRGPAIRGIALVATRALHDGEELFQNYRLSPRAPRPPWYHTVDPDEERRRWTRSWSW